MKWWRWLLLSLLIILGLGVTFFLTSMPLFTNDYQKLTERVEIGVKYTDPKEDVLYIHPYIENPNSSELTLTHTQNFIKVDVLDESRNALDEAVVGAREDDSTDKTSHTILGPGEMEKTRDYYKLQLPRGARWIQLYFSGDVKDEFGQATVNKMIEVDIKHLRYF